jgi:dCMP deaminase
LKQVLLYLPVMQAGYEAFLARHADADGILLLGREFAGTFPSLRKDIRALDPERAARYVRLTAGSTPVTVTEPGTLAAAVTADLLVMPDEEIMHELTAQFGLDQGRAVRYERTFLRWDRSWSTAERPVSFDGQVTSAELPRALLGQAAAAAGRSSDWWRRVGAVAARGGEVIGTAWNHHHPSEYAPYLDGDPRDSFRRGLRADLSTAIHAEAAVVAQAARAGTSLDGADLYVTTFPCPACARLIAESGVRRCFFAIPYSVLDGDAILRAAGVELIWVSTSPPGPSTHPPADPAP